MLRETADQAPIIRLLGEVESLDPRLLVKLDIATACMTPLEAEFPSIRRYSYMLRLLSEQVQRKERIDVKTSGFEFQTVTLERFFYSSDGVRLDVSSETAGFKGALIAAIRTYQALDTASVNLDTHNARVLLAVIQNAAQIATTLRTHSLAS